MEKYVLLKLARTPGRVDFFKAHKEVIDQYGYVDFARISKGRICDKYLCGKTIYIKESKTQGDRVFKATVGGQIESGVNYPDYYNLIDISNAQWIRLEKLEIIDQEKFLENYRLMNGKDLVGTFRGAVPWVFIQKSK